MILDTVDDLDNQRITEVVWGNRRSSTIQHFSVILNNRAFDIQLRCQFHSGKSL